MSDTTHLMFPGGEYEYKGKRYRAAGTLRKGAGVDKGRLFVDYFALYQCDHPFFSRDVEDFTAKFVRVQDAS